MKLKELIAAITEGKTEGVNIEGELQALIDSAVTGAASGLQSKNAQLLEQLNKLKKDAKGVPEGFDPEVWKKLLKEQEEGKTAKLKAEERWDELQTQLTTKHTADLQQRDGTIKGLEKALAAQLVDNQATAQLLEAGGNSALLLPHIKTHLKMVKETNEAGEDVYTTQIIDPSKGGEQRFSLDEKTAGKPMAIAELVNEFKLNPVYAPAFAAQNGGGGAGGAPGGGGVVNPFIKGEHFSFTEQAKLNRSDPGLAKQMMAAAKAAPSPKT